MTTDLGPVFGQKQICGPCVVQYIAYANKHVTIVGEFHDVHGDTHGNPLIHAVDQIASIKNTNETICFIEQSFSGSRMQAQNCLGMMEAMESNSGIDKHFTDVPKPPINIYSTYFNTNNMPIRTIFSDVRHLVPYDMVMLLYHPRDYGALHNYQDSDDMVTDMKLAEKTLIKHLRTRVDAKKLLKTLVLPKKRYKKWFVDLFRILNQTDNDPPDLLREKMAALKTRDRVLYNRLVSHIDTYEDYWAVAPYTIAMGKIEKMRHTESPNFVVEKNKDIKSLFLEMFTFLIDINILTDLFLNTFQNYESIIIVVGCNHLWNISRFFEGIDGVSGMTYKSNYGGNIPEGPASEGRHERPSVPTHYMQRLEIL